jgi:hypothetical protein
VKALGDIIGKKHMHDDAFLSVPPMQLAQTAALREKIGWICHLVRAFAFLWASWELILTLWVWLHRSERLAKAEAWTGVDPASVSDAGYWSAAAVEVAGWGFVAAVALAIWRLMGGYLQGEIFTVGAAGRLRSVALTGFATATAAVIINAVSLALLSPAILAKAPLHIWFGPINLLYFLMCGFLLALSAIFKTAAEIADEYAQFV